MRYVGGNRLTLLRNGAQYFPALVQAIDAAREELFLESYIYADDETGSLVTDALARAAARGVRVHALIDGFGARDFPERFRRTLASAGAQLLVFRPLSEADRQKARDIAELLAMIPKNASVASSEMEHPHVSTRLNSYVLRVGYEGADYILYAEDGYGSDQAKGSLDRGEYEVMERRPDSRIALLRKKTP